MPNHVHLIVVPHTVEALARAIGQGHEDYTRYVNFKKGWKGHLWQGRFASYPMDESHLLLAARYIELNPVSAHLVSAPELYAWSSTKAHLGLEPSAIMNVQPLLELVPVWLEFLHEGLSTTTIDLIEKHQRTGRPLGSTQFLLSLEQQTGLGLLPKRPGRKPGRKT